MKVLHVVNHLELGGTPHLLVKHIGCLVGADVGISNVVCILGAQAQAYQDYLDMLPVAPSFLHFSGRYRSLGQSLACILRLRALIRKERPDLMHTYLWNSDVFGALARAGLGVPQVVHVVDRRGDRDSRRLIARWQTRLTGWLLRQGRTRFVAVSEACRGHAIYQFQLRRQDVVTAHNGIPVAQFFVSPRDVPKGRPLVMGTISNFVEEKGHRYLIEAFGLLATAGVQATLRIAGDGSARPELEALAATLGVSERIAFAGRVKSAAAFYRDIDAFVIPSIAAEGLPTTILEAMAARLPVIATRVGGAVEAIDDGVQGLIVAPRSAQALADAIGALVAAPDLVRQMGEAGYQRVTRDFTLTGMTGTVLQSCYRPLVKSARQDV